ncbi:type IV toxin-antitoxin system AbiEi family antitoxin domain-containing protein [Klenkia marina]|nr:type IV toxin-antitoxin system AbiEi family antitoxin domain-containing protein [Klenkia marina]
MTARQELWNVAVEQYGYVTKRDADELDLDRHTVEKLAGRGLLERVAHGVYRFPELPVTEYDTHMLAVLWTGRPDACLSHDTALAGYDVCDINPDRIHLTLPKRERIRRNGGDRYVVHYQDLAPDQLGWWHRIPTVTLPTAIDQGIASGIPTYLLRQALRTGRDRGLLTAAQAATLTDDLERRDVG